MYLFSHWPIPITSSVFNHIGRKNQYDGVEEYYVDVREKGTREEKEEQEEIKRSREKLEDRSCLCTQMITSFQQMITSKNQNHSQILLCFYPSVGVTLIRFLPINAPAQESQKPTLEANAFKGLDGLKDRLAADSTTPTGGSGNQSIEASSKSYCKKTCMGLILVMLWISIDFLNPPKSLAVSQMKKRLQKFLDSVIQKSGKSRALIRDIRADYASSSVMQRHKMTLIIIYVI